MNCGKPAFTFRQYPYERPDVVPDVMLEVTLFNRDIKRDEIIEEFQRFLVGAGYYFAENETIGVITDE